MDGDESGIVVYPSTQQIDAHLEFDGAGVDIFLVVLGQVIVQTFLHRATGHLLTSSLRHRVTVLPCYKGKETRD